MMYVRGDFYEDANDVMQTMNELVEFMNSDVCMKHVEPRHRRVIGDVISILDQLLDNAVE